MFVATVTTTEREVIRWGRERVRVGNWRGMPDVACVTPLAGAPPPSAALVERCVHDLARRGFARVMTAALAPAEQPGFFAAGFEIEEHLHVLAHDLRRVPQADTSELRRARPADLAGVLEVDGRAFVPFWHLDGEGLADALSATAKSRFRVFTAADRVVAYAITGRAARRGYLQRLAVDPDHQRQGVGRALVVDALRWLRRWHAEDAVVNTQLDNAAALALYEGLGFRRQPSRLAVLSRPLRP